METMVRVTNPSDSRVEVYWDSLPYDVPAGGSRVYPVAVADHLVKYHGARAGLQCEVVTATYETAKPAPAAFTCQYPGCGQQFSDAAAFQAHVMDHANLGDKPAKENASAAKR